MKIPPVLNHVACVFVFTLAAKITAQTLPPPVFPPVRPNPATMPSGTVVAWGSNDYGECNVPPGLSNVVAIAAGSSNPHSLALKSDGTVLTWGDVREERIVPFGLSDVVAIAAKSHSLALKSDGTVVAWGSNNYGSCNVPPGLSDVVAIAAGHYYSLALKNNGTVVAWGDNTCGQCNVPDGLSDVVAIAAGGYHSLALKSDGTVVAWGGNTFGECNVPPGLSGIVAITTGGYKSFALKSNGTVIMWGIKNNKDMYQVPVVAIASGSELCLALKKDGTVIGYWVNSVGPDIFPITKGTLTKLSETLTELSGVIAIAAEQYQYLAILKPTISFVNVPEISKALDIYVAELKRISEVQIPPNQQRQDFLIARKNAIINLTKKFITRLDELRNEFQKKGDTQTAEAFEELINKFKDAKSLENFAQTPQAANWFDVKTFELLKEVFTQSTPTTQHQSPKDLFERGENFYHGQNGVKQDYAEAFKYFSQAAHQGYVQAQTMLGNCYKHGNGVAQSHVKAFECYQKAATKGDSTAQFQLGLCYLHGQGVTQDYMKAGDWFEKSGDATGGAYLHNLGSSLLDGSFDPLSGLTPKQNYKQAFQILLKAESIQKKTSVDRQGDAATQYALGWCYYNGNGVAQNTTIGIELWQKAARRGSNEAQSVLRQIGRGW